MNDLTLEDAIESGQFTGRPQSVSDLFTDDDERTPEEIMLDANPDGPPCDVDPIAHEERLAYLEQDDGQD